MSKDLSFAGSGSSHTPRTSLAHSQHNIAATNSCKNYQFHKANILDIPYIFNLLQEGSFIGSFANFLMTSEGYFLVLKTLFWGAFPLRVFRNKQEEVTLYIFSLNGEDIGFMKIKTLLTAGNIQVIDLCAIDPAHRNQKHGSQMIRMYIESLPTGTEVIAYCTKYSRAMQHILIRQKFRRDKKSFPLECYRFKKSVDVAHAEPSPSLGSEKSKSNTPSEILLSAR